MAAKKTTKKTAAKKAASKASGKAKKAPTAKKDTAKKPVTKKVTAKKVAVKKATAKKSRKPSLVKTPPPAAPARPKFVPPPSDPVRKSGGTGRHSESFIKKQRQRLIDLRETLVDAMNGISRDTIRNAPEGSDASGSGQHQGDAGSDSYDRDFALSVLAKEQDALYEIDHALMSIKAGNYGQCEISGKKIPTARLEAIPFARLTVECQADWEKEHGNRRFRPSDEVGFSGGHPQEEEQSVSVSLDGDDD